MSISETLDRLQRGSEAPAIRGIVWVLLRDGLVVLERCPKKARVLGVGEWFLPGGKIEGDETPVNALYREMTEEWPGVRLLSAAPLPVVSGSPIPPGPRGLFLMQPYAVVVGGHIPSESADGVELSWWPVASALNSPVPQVRMMVAAAMEADPFTARPE